MKYLAKKETSDQYFQLLCATNCKTSFNNWFSSLGTKCLEYVQEL